MICTGGGPGIMEAGNRGAAEAGGISISLNIVLPHEQAPNLWGTPELSFNFHYFAMRKMHFLMRARAIAVFPGGFGTLDELFEVLTLVQTGRMARAADPAVRRGVLAAGDLLARRWSRPAPSRPATSTSSPTSRARPRPGSASRTGRRASRSPSLALSLTFVQWLRQYEVGLPWVEQRALYRAPMAEYSDNVAARDLPKQ